MIVVLGAGIAGMVAALELARRGQRVRLIETAPFGGGRTSSWVDPLTGRTRDTGIHVLAEHYVNLLDVLESVGAADRLVRWDEHLYLCPGREPLTLRLGPLAAPFHLSYAAAHIPLSLGEKTKLLRAGIRDVIWRKQSDLVGLDRISYLDWHNRHGLGRGFLLELAEVAADASAFLSVEEVSARAVLSWLKYLGRDESSARLYTWRSSMGEDLVEPLVSALRAWGVQIDFGTAVTAVDLSAGKTRSVTVRPSREPGPFHRAGGKPLTKGKEEVIPCDMIISALPVQSLRRIVTAEQAKLAGLEDALTLDTVPAASVTITLDRAIRPVLLGAPVVAGGSIRNFAQKSETAFQFLLSREACLDALGSAPEALTARVFDDFQRVWPDVRGAKPVHADAYRIEAALFAARPGAHALRPPTETRVPGFFVAGDWTRHELNGSMEGAALSGRLAARAALGRERGSEVPVLSAREAKVTELYQNLARPLFSRTARGQSSAVPGLGSR